MNINKTEREKLFTGLGLFQSEFRSYIISFLKQKSGDNWVKEFEKTLKKEQQRNWEKDLKRGRKPEELIDFHHFKSFADENKDLLKKDFPGKNQSITIWLGEIADVRHKIAHYNGIEEDEATKIWIHLRTIAKFLGKNELEQELLKLTKSAPVPAVVSKIEPTQKINQFRTERPISNQHQIETLDIVNCAGLKQEVFDEEVYICPAQGGNYKHRQCKYFGIYWQKRVGAIGDIEAVVDVYSENEAEIYWINGNQNAEDYITKAKEKAVQLRANSLPQRIFLITNSPYAKEENLNDLQAAALHCQSLII